MTVPNTIRLKEYAGDDTLTVFSYPFKIFSSDSLIVTLIVDATEAETVQTISTHYTVDGVGAPRGGNVTMVTPPATGETLRVERTPEFVQQTDLRNQGNFTPQQVENMGDHLMHCIQALSEGAISLTVDDPHAIHDNIANEISAVTFKATPVDADLVLIEDSASGFVKKKVAFSAIGGWDNTIYTDTGPDNRPTANAANLGHSYRVQNPGDWMRQETIYRKKDGSTYERHIDWTSFD